MLLNFETLKLIFEYWIKATEKHEQIECQLVI